MCGVSCFGFRISGCGVLVSGSELVFRVPGSGFPVLVFGFPVSGFGFRPSVSLGFRVPGSGFQGSQPGRGPARARLGMVPRAPRSKWLQWKRSLGPAFWRVPGAPGSWGGRGQEGLMRMDFLGPVTRVKKKVWGRFASFKVEVWGEEELDFITDSSPAQNNHQ